ncbi:MAG: hypothetical protein AAB926_00095, partial [Patescibacteria group bacterium]
NPEAVAFLQSVLGSMFKGLASAKPGEGIRITLQLGLLGVRVNYDSIKEYLNQANSLVKDEGDAGQWMGFVVDRKQHRLVVLADIMVEDSGAVSVEQCKERYQKMVKNMSEHLATMLS